MRKQQEQTLYIHCGSNKLRSVISQNPVYHESAMDPKFSRSINLSLKTFVVTNLSKNKN